MLDTTTIGAALRDTRELSGLRPRAAARALGVRPGTLRSWEDTRATPPIAVLERATDLYSHGLDDLLPHRVPLIDPTRPDRLIVGDEVIAAAPADSGDRPANRDLLERYVGAVRRQRGLAAHDAVELRRDDVAALAIHLDVADAELGALLADVLGTTDQRAAAARRALLVGALITIVATGAVPDPWCRTAPRTGSRARPHARTWTAIAPDMVDEALAGNARDGEPLFSPWIRLTIPDVGATRARRPGGADRPQISTPFSVDAVERPATIPLKPFSDEPREPAERPTFGPRSARSTTPERPEPGMLFAPPGTQVPETKALGVTLALPPTR